MLKRIIHSISVVFSVLAIGWIIVGSTVEFHQRYVYHNHIDLVNVHFLKLKEKESEKYFRFLDKNQGFQIGPGFFNVSLNSPSEIAVLNLCKKNTYSRYLFDLITPEYIIPNALRGPPQA